MTAEFPYRDASLPVETRVADLLSRMTLQEKIAQMSMFDMQTNNLPAEAIALDGPTREQMKHGVGALGRPGLYSPARATAEWANAFQKFLREIIQDFLFLIQKFGCFLKAHLQDFLDVGV